MNRIRNSRATGIGFALLGAAMLALALATLLAAWRREGR